MRGLKLLLWKIPGLFLRPGKCPDCGSRRIDAQTPATAGTMILYSFGLTIYVCHECDFAHVTFRSFRRAGRS